MLSEAIVSAPLSRPKIHRLPGAAVKQRRQTHSSNRGTFAFALLLLLLTLFGYATERFARGKNQAQAEKMSEMIPDAISSAQAATPPIGGVTAGARQSQAIEITSKNGGIVGQITKIPLQNEQIAGIKTVSEVDNRTGQELLGIIGKY